MTAQSPQSRFQVVERPVALPAKCSCCGNGMRRSVDFGVNIRGYGAVYLCMSCIGEAARVFGFVSPDELVKQTMGTEQSTNKYLNDNNLVAVDRGIFESLADNFAGLFDDFRLLRADVPVSDADAPSEVNSGEPATDSSDSGKRQATSGQKSSTSSKRRPASVPADSSDESDGNS